MVMTELIKHHAAYNAWMNEQLYAACATLTDMQRHADVGAFFTSIHGTLKHLLVTDVARMRQFDPAHAFWQREDAGDPTAWDVLCTRRTEVDRELVAWAGRVGAADLQREVETDCWVDRRLHRYPLWKLAVHMFNHQTHHRGQVTAFVYQVGVDYGITGWAWQPDLLEPSRIP